MQSCLTPIFKNNIFFYKLLQQTNLMQFSLISHIQYHYAVHDILNQITLFFCLDYIFMRFSKKMINLKTLNNSYKISMKIRNYIIYPLILKIVIKDRQIFKELFLWKINIYVINL